MRSRVIAAALLVTGVSVASAADFERGRTAYERGDYDAARREFRALIERGDAAGEFGLGVIYYMGAGVPKDYKKAAMHWREAAERGFAKAQHWLGILYGFGKGVSKNDREASFWWRKAAPTRCFWCPIQAGVHVVFWG